MIEIEVSDFQSIRHTDVTIDKFSVIVGRSNIGKSALVRAVQFALTGAVGTDFVRHGAACDRAARGTKKCKCFSRVRVKTSAIEFTWEKGDNVNRYTVIQEGVSQVYEGLDRGTPPFLADTFQPIKVGDSKELAQIPDQFEPIFLLNKSGTVVADVLSDVAQLDEINVAMAMAVKDRKDCGATRKVRTQDIVDLNKSLEKYLGSDTAVAAAAALQVRLEGAKHKQTQADLLDRFVASAKALTLSLTTLNKATAPALPDLEPLKETSGSLTQIGAFCSKVSDLAPQVQSLSGVTSVTLPEDPNLQVGPQKLSKMGVWLNRLQSLKASLDGWETLEKVPEVEDQAPVKAKYLKLVGLNILVSKVVAIEASYSTAKKDLEAVIKLEAEILKELNDLGMCPACSQSIDAEHALHLEAS